MDASNNSSMEPDDTLAARVERMFGNYKQFQTSLKQGHPPVGIAFDPRTPTTPGPNHHPLVMTPEKNMPLKKRPSLAVDEVTPGALPLGSMGPPENGVSRKRPVLMLQLPPKAEKIPEKSPAVTPERTPTIENLMHSLRETVGPRPDTPISAIHTPKKKTLSSNFSVPINREVNSSLEQDRCREVNLQNDARANYNHSSSEHRLSRDRADMLNHDLVPGVPAKSLQVVNDNNSTGIMSSAVSRSPIPASVTVTPQSHVLSVPPSSRSFESPLVPSAKSPQSVERLSSSSERVPPAKSLLAKSVKSNATLSRPPIKSASEATRPNTAFTKSSALVKFSEPTVEPTPPIAPVSASVKPIQPVKPLSSVKPSASSRPTSALVKPTPSAKPVSAPVKPTPSVKPVSAFVKPTPSAKPVSAPVKPTPSVKATSAPVKPSAPLRPNSAPVKPMSGLSNASAHSSSQSSESEQSSDEVASPVRAPSSSSLSPSSNYEHKSAPGSGPRRASVDSDLEECTDPASDDAFGEDWSINKHIYSAGGHKPHSSPVGHKTLGALQQIDPNCSSESSSPHVSFHSSSNASPHTSPARAALSPQRKLTKTVRNGTARPRGRPPKRSGVSGRKPRPQLVLPESSESDCSDTPQRRYKAKAVRGRRKSVRDAAVERHNSVDGMLRSVLAAPTDRLLSPLVSTAVRQLPGHSPSTARSNDTKDAAEVPSSEAHTVCHSSRSLVAVNRTRISLDLTLLNLDRSKLRTKSKVSTVIKPDAKPSELAAARTSEPLDVRLTESSGLTGSDTDVHNPYKPASPRPVGDTSSAQMERFVTAGGDVGGDLYVSSSDEADVDSIPFKQSSRLPSAEGSGASKPEPRVLPNEVPTFSSSQKPSGKHKSATPNNSSTVQGKPGGKDIKEVKKNRVDTALKRRHDGDCPLKVKAESEGKVNRSLPDYRQIKGEESGVSETKRPKTKSTIEAAAKEQPIPEAAAARHVNTAQRPYLCTPSAQYQRLEAAQKYEASARFFKRKYDSLNASGKAEKYELWRYSLLTALQFTLMCLAQERDKGRLQAVKLLKETLALFHSQVNHVKAKRSDCAQKDAVYGSLSYRVQSLFNKHIYAQRHREAMELKQVLDRTLCESRHLPVTQSPAPVHTASPSSPTPSPAASVASSASQQGGAAGSPSSSVSVSVAVHQASQNYIKYTNYLLMSEDLWRHADLKQERAPDFFNELQSRVGTLTYHGGLLSLVSYVEEALDLLRTL